jgi:hypothetical protein
MFQGYFPNVLSIPDVCYKCLSGYCIYIYVASICFKRFQVFHTYICKYFIWMLHMIPLVFKYFSGAFTSVSDVCFKCFIYLFLCVTTVASRCFKKYAHVIHVGKRLAARAHCWCARSWALHDARRLLTPCAGTVRTLALRSNVRALASPWSERFWMNKKRHVLNRWGFSAVGSS